MLCNFVCCWVVASGCSAWLKTREVSAVVHWREAHFSTERNIDGSCSSETLVASKSIFRHQRHNCLSFKTG